MALPATAPTRERATGQWGDGATGVLSPCRPLARSSGLARYALEFAAASALALLLALYLPLAATVFGLIAFGLLHTFFELRYVVGRFGALLERPFLDLLLVGLTLIAIVRLIPSEAWGPRLEILIGYLLLASALAWHGHRRPRLLLGSLGALAGLAGLSLAQPDYHFVVLAHLHNVVPLFFLWEWSRRAASGMPRGVPGRPARVGAGCPRAAAGRLARWPRDAGSQPGLRVRRRGHDRGRLHAAGLA